jgi:hypothetical protein
VDREQLSVCRPVLGGPKLSYLGGMLVCVTAAKLREWRGVKPVAGPAGWRSALGCARRLPTSTYSTWLLSIWAGCAGRTWPRLHQQMGGPALAHPA